MNNEKNNNDRDGIKSYIPVLVAIIVTFGATVGGNYVLVTDLAPELAAPDRFTGTEAKAFERRLDAHKLEIAELRREMDKLPPRELTERILKLEVGLHQLQIDFKRVHPD